MPSSCASCRPLSTLCWVLSSSRAAQSGFGTGFLSALPPLPLRPPAFCAPLDPCEPQSGHPHLGSLHLWDPSRTQRLISPPPLSLLTLFFSSGAYVVPELAAANRRVRGTESPVDPGKTRVFTALHLRPRSP